MKFLYRRFLVAARPGSHPVSVLRPVIPVHVRHGRRSVGYEALLDSGADFSIFHAEIGEAIGLEVRKGGPVSFSGIGGGCRGFRHRVSLAMGARSFRCQIVFAYGLDMPYGLLGQAEVFDRFRVTFSRRGGWVTLQPTSSSLRP